MKLRDKQIEIIREIEKSKIVELNYNERQIGMTTILLLYGMCMAINRKKTIFICQNNNLQHDIKSVYQRYLWLLRNSRDNSLLNNNLFLDNIKSLKYGIHGDFFITTEDNLMDKLRGERFDCFIIDYYEPTKCNLFFNNFADLRYYFMKEDYKIIYSQSNLIK